MTIDIKVPILGESVVEATIARWMKHKGDAVQADEAVVELETDKVTLEVPAPVSGVLIDIVAQEGATVEVGALLARLEEGAVDAKKEISASAPTPAPASDPAPPAQTRAPQASAPQNAPQATTSMPLSPAVRKLIEEHQLDPAAIKASGKDGRLTKGDVMQAIESQKSSPPSSASSSGPSPASSSVTPPPPAPVSGQISGVREERVPMSRLRRMIASRLKEAQNTAAMLTTFNEVDMSAVMALRSSYKEEFEKNHGARLGFMGFFVQAVIAALREFPAVNAEISGDEIIYKNFYNIGVAVGTPQGLVVPVLKEAQHLSLADIEKGITDFGLRARDGKLVPNDMAGGTFTISNGGVYGSMMSTPILNAPQSGILGMHKIQNRPVTIGDKIESRPMMYLALSYDHRIIDGREAVSFLVRVKESIEDPRRLLLGV